jgi:putative transcriptional regulator
MSQAKAKSLAPCFLLAPPSLVQPAFREALILLVAHEEQGSLGIIVNRKSSLPFWDVVDDLELSGDIDKRRTQPAVWMGGPVQGEAGHMLYEHHPDEPLAPGLPVTSSLSLSPSRSVLEAAAMSRLPGRFALVLGHAGWGAGQLEQELLEGTWLHADFDLEMVFNIDVEQRWHTAYARLLGVDPGEVISVKGGAQA